MKVNKSVFSNDYQNKWFPGVKDERCIYDFSNGLLEISKPGFPFVDNDIASFGNVFTWSDGSDRALYLIGRTLVDENYKEVDNSQGLFDTLNLNSPNVVFMPVNEEQHVVAVYFINEKGLNYARIQLNELNEYYIADSQLINMNYPPMYNSPLSIACHSEFGITWLFYIASFDGYPKLNIVKCNETVVESVSLTPVPVIPETMSLDVTKSHISLLLEKESILYGDIKYSAESVDVNFKSNRTDISKTLKSCAFSADDKYIFFTTEEDGKNFINYIELETGYETKHQIYGSYKNLKLSPISNIYGLADKNSSTAGVFSLSVEPVDTDIHFSIVESYAEVSDGYFPNVAFKFIDL